MNIQLLREKATPPGDEVLNNSLYLSLVESWQPEWKYYNDMKAWLCKVSDGRKTIFWLSVWEGFFQVSFYFLERHLEGLAALNTKYGRLEKEWGKRFRSHSRCATSRLLPKSARSPNLRKKRNESDYSTP